MAYNERWSTVPVEIHTVINGKVWQRSHTTVGRVADPIGGQTAAIRDTLARGETYMCQQRGIISIISLCKCEG